MSSDLFQGNLQNNIQETSFHQEQPSDKTPYVTSVLAGRIFSTMKIFQQAFFPSDAMVMNKTF